MPSDAPQPSVSPESLERKHEVSEKRVRNVLIVSGGAAFLVVFSLVVCAALYHFFSQMRPMQWMPPLGLIHAPDLKPLERFPKPNLQIDDDHAERTALIGRQEFDLTHYGWLDRSNGIVRIPISRAIDLIAQRGLPYRTNGISKTDGSALQLIQKIPEQK